MEIAVLDRIIHGKGSVGIDEECNLEATRGPLLLYEREGWKTSFSLFLFSRDLTRVNDQLKESAAINILIKGK